MKRKPKTPATLTIWNELQASTTKPISAEFRTTHLSRIYAGLDGLFSDSPKSSDWRMVADASNLLDTMVDPMGICDDSDGLIAEACKAMSDASEYIKRGEAVQWENGQKDAIKSVVHDYATMLESLPERTIIRSMRLTEIRMREILSGKRKQGDIVVTLNGY